MSKRNFSTTAAAKTSSSVKLYAGTPVSSDKKGRYTLTVEPRRKAPAPNIDAAVYAQIQAMRALGRTQVNVSEIARALGVPADRVHEATKRLADQGVREVK